MSEAKRFTFDFNGRNLVVEIGELAKQATAAAIIRYDKTAVLSVAQASKEPSELDFFPLMVMYTEKLYAAGKIPGGFLKREGRPSELETLTARLIDRPLRPLFPDGFKYDIQIINTVLSGDINCSPPMTAMFGSSLALGLSPMPFKGPIAGVLVGRVDGEFVVNPTEEQLVRSDIDLIVAGTKDAINMVEAGAKQVSEKDMLEAIMYGHDWIKKLVAFQEEIIAELGQEKIAWVKPEENETVVSYIEKNAEKELIVAAGIHDRTERSTVVKAIQEKVITALEAQFSDLDKDDRKKLLKTAKSLMDDVIKKEVRRLIIEEKVRPDGRDLAELRALNSKVDILELTHGSALFTRGQTQALSITTLGALGESQYIDGLGETDNKRFMLHYNFPAYSVGETGRYGPPGRREVGHGALGERALIQVLPNEEDFPYTIRIVSEILESNGSTSQASICAGCMSLMAAGVPISAPVAGIAMGLISDGKTSRVLTDIQGLEDHLGDMDFKVAGTKDGITALQMDIKIDGLSRDILEEALEQARIGRLQILENMLQAIPEARKEVSKYAPKVKVMLIDPDKIRDVIGPGGKQITQIIEKCNDVKIDIEQDGRVTLMHIEMAPIECAVKFIENIVRVAKVGEVYKGKVVRIEKFGCFVELWKGTDGLCHISKLAHDRVNKVEDIVKLGQLIDVKVIGIDDRGRIDLSHAATIPKPEKQEKAPTDKKE
ncbi:polyribonucleotide nucleotidyltransferase [Liberiplasma polymorphum]|uniref:polyribonucleotide nucleotidyltransferase n=1 Tax=Liberiplasma polymorphum TaxID=3374570 RepID=UPI003771D56E